MILLPHSRRCSVANNSGMWWEDVWAGWDRQEQRAAKFPLPHPLQWNGTASLSHKLYESTLLHLSKERGAQLKDGKQTCFYFESTTAQGTAVLDRHQNCCFFKHSRPIKPFAVAQKQNGPSFHRAGNNYNEFRMHNSSFTVASAPVSKRNAHHMLFLVAQCKLIFFQTATPGFNKGLY